MHQGEIEKEIFTKPTLLRRSAGDQNSYMDFTNSVFAPQVILQNAPSVHVPQSQELPQLPAPPSLETRRCCASCMAILGLLKELCSHLQEELQARCAIPEEA